MATGVVEQVSPQRFCSECGKPHSIDDLVQFGDASICAECKPIFVQRMREGTAGSIGAVVYGGFWRRFAAQMVDAAVMFYMLFPAWVLIMAAVVFSALKTGANGTDGASPLLQALPALFFFVAWPAVSIFYSVYFTKHGGSTPGKMLLGLKIVTASGGSIGTGRAIGRFFARGLSSLILYIGDIMVGFDSQKRALHDRICDTRVIRIDPTLFGRRIGAFAVDMLFVGFFYYSVLIGWNLWHNIPFLATTINPSPAAAILDQYARTWKPTAIAMALQMLYSVYFTSQKGATPGKMLAGLKVIAATGATIGVGRAFARYLSTAFLSQFLTLGFGMTMAAFDNQGRALEDRVCGTRVVRATDYPA